MSSVNPPAIILIRPQLGQNIGMVARAMLNCALTELRLVDPRDGWPNPDAVAAASGADALLEAAKVYATTEDAIADLNWVVATTARPRGMTKDIFTPRQVAAELRAVSGKGGILVGREASGLENDDIALADAIVTVPLNPDFTSLNIAQAVLLVGYEWFQAGDDTPDEQLVFPKQTRPASKEKLIALFDHLERELDACGFLRNKEKRPIMVRNLRNMFQRTRMTEQEVRTMHGIIKELVRGSPDDA